MMRQKILFFVYIIFNLFFHKNNGKFRWTVRLRTISIKKIMTIKLYIIIILQHKKKKKINRTTP